MTLAKTTALVAPSPAMSPDALGALDDAGWCALDLPFAAFPTERLAAWASALGSPVPSTREGPLVDILRVRSRADAPVRSLSGRHGTGPFPLHTDQARVPWPPRYVVLRCRRSHESDRPTLLQPLDALALSAPERAALRRSVWVVDGGRGRFLATILRTDPATGREQVRYDDACMRPAHPAFAASGEVLRAAAARVEPARVNWREGRVLVVDNWRVLHGRAANEAGGDRAEERELERVLVR